MSYTKFILFFIVLFFLSFVQAVELGVSPSEIKFDGDAGNEICKKFIVFSKDYTGEVQVYDKWKYNNEEINSTAFGINADYDSEFELNEYEEEEICFNYNYGGKFNGLISFRTADGSVEVNMFIGADISGKEKDFQTDKNKGVLTGNESYTGSNVMTGFSVNNGNQEILLNGTLVSSCLILGLILLVLIIKIRND